MSVRTFKICLFPKADSGAQQRTEVLMSFEDDLKKIAPFPYSHGDVSKVLNVIVLEDSHVDRHFIECAVEQSDLKLECTHAETLKVFETEVASKSFDLAMLDFYLPDGTGIEGMNLLAASSKNFECPMIMIASETQVQNAVTAMKYGCSDYILKADLTGATLRRAVLNAIQKAALRGQIREARALVSGIKTTLASLADRSNHQIKPILGRCLTQASALEFLCESRAEPQAKARLEIIERSCRNLLQFCDEVEQEASRLGEMMESFT